MGNIDYQKILFRTAMCVMTCDGEIHESEIKEMELAFKQTEFFKDLVFNDEMKMIVSEFEQDEKKVVKDYFEQLASINLNPVQQLQILEIALRIDDNEVKFFKIVKSFLDVPDEILYKRFGQLDYLGGEHSPDKLISTTNDFLDSIVLPEIQEMAKMIDNAETVNNSNTN